MVQGPMHKVIAAPGLLDPGAEGVTLWHDYGSFALYRVSDAALEALSAEVRSRITVADDMDRLLFDNIEIDAQAMLTEPAIEAEPADMVVLQFSGPVEEKWLLVVEETGAKPLQALSADSYLIWADADSRAQLDNLVKEGKFLRSVVPHALDAQPPTREPAADAVQAAEPGPALHLVQFVGPIKNEWLDAVAAVGATPIQYIATNGYLLWADTESRARLDELVAQGEFLQFSAPYPSSSKVGPALAARDNPDDVVPVVIQMYWHDGRASSEAVIEDLAVEVLSGWTPILKFQNIIVTLPVADVGTIASLPDVFWIEERMERQLLDEVQGQILAGNFNADQSGPSAPGYLDWLDSYGFSTNPADYPIVDVTDDGIGNGTVNSGDPTLHQLGDLANPTRLAYVANCTNSASGEGVDGHGHINTSIVGGYDTRSGFPYVDPLGYQRGLGINPYGRLAGTRIFDPGFDQSACGGSDTGVIQSVQNSGALINTNSWGCSGCAGTYDDSSQAYDAGVRDADLDEVGNQEMIIVFSAGNSGPGSGTVGTPGNGKNMITVGASENQRPSDEDGAWTDDCGIGPSGADNAMDVISFSSRGPSPGSRVKPEVIAPGTHIQGTASTNAGYTGNSVCDQYRPSGQTVFAASSGTSHSTPAVAGVTSLAYWWMENTLGVATPSPAVMKAYLIAHPTYLTGVSANDTLPSNSQGYGMPNMSAMFDDASKYLLDQSVTFDNSGEVWTWEGAVADPSKPVRIVLAYTDAPGAIGTSPQVNDLNLAADVGGMAYLGNVFSGQWSVTGGSADPFNNYEAIFLPAGASGAIEITVVGFNIAGDGVPNTGDGTDQDFALVCYNCAQTPTFSLNVTPASLNICAPDDAVYNVDVGSILGFSDSVNLSASGHPAGTTASFSVNPVTPPGSSTMTIGNTGAAAAGSYSIDVSGTSTPGSQTRTVDLNLFDLVPAGPTLLTPADGAVDVSFKPTFSWTAVAQAASYLLDVATDAGFTNIVYTASETGTSHTAAVPLSADTTYYWRVTAKNVCGDGTSVTFSFTTQAATMVCNGSAVDFEDGIPADWTVVNNSPGGIVWTTTADPACGQPNRTNGTGEAACADSDAAGAGAPPYDTELVSNPIDLTAWGAAVLDVKAYYNDITTGGNDRFEVDVWDGVGWTNELTWDEDHMPEDFTLSLAAYAGLPVVQVRFRYSGDGYDWYAQVDDIALTCVPVSDPVIEVDPADLYQSQGPAVVSTQPMTITNSGGSPLNWNIAEDDTACDSPTDIPWLSVAPDTGTTLPLDSTVVDVSFDSAGLAPGFYTANLCVDSNDEATGMVQVPALLTVEPPEILECNGDMIEFEDGIPSGWPVIDNTGGSGIVWVTTDDPACEQPNRTNGTGEAACADSDAAGYPAIPYDTELWTPLIDLSGQGAVVLDVKAYYNDISTGYNDRFEVDVWDGVGWTNELSWDEDHMPEDFSLNLSAYAGLPDARVRFRYSGDGYDWYAQVDDIALTCAAVGLPVIGVDPASLAAEQGPDVQSAQQLNISNSGGGPLNWYILEDDSACDSPNDIPWLAVSPDAGTTPPLDSSIVDVTFDSTGLTPGDYNANLCVNSDDPVTPMVQVPVMLTVLPPFTLECNGEVADFETGIPSGWQAIDNAGTGLVWTTIAGSGETGNYTGGAGDAATASSDRFGPSDFDTELRTTSIDLSGWLPSDEVTLEYLANYQNYVAYDYLDLDISIDGGATWTTLLSWNEDHGSFRGTTGEAVSIDLSPFAGMSGLKLRWRYYDPTAGADWDWYAQIDEAGLTCVPNPIIDVDPDSLSYLQEPDQQQTQILTIGNLGSADLDWTIDEAPALAAPVPAGVPAADNGPGEPPAEPDPAKVEEDGMVLTPSAQSLSASADRTPSTVPFSPRNGVPLGLLVNDGSFESGPPPASAWTETTNNACEWIGDWAAIWGAAAYDGVYDYWGGGYCSGVPSTDSVEQMITVPAGGLLSFWYLSYRPDSDDAELDTAYISVDGTEIWSLDLIQANDTYPNWVNATVDLSAYEGQTVNLKLGANSFGSTTGNIRFDFLEFATGCELPSDVPWLSVSPDMGTTAPGSSTPVDVTTDSTGLGAGVYDANLCVRSNDPATPLVPVPVEMRVNVPPMGEATPGTQWPQYSDEITPISVEVMDNIGDVLTAVPSWSSDGGPFNPGLPDFLALSAPSCIDSGGGMQTCTWTVSGVIDLPEGSYTVRTTVSDDYGGVTVVDAVIEVIPEDATVAYDDGNPVDVQVAEPGGVSGPFSLTMYVTEKQPDLPADGVSGVAPGDISRANVAVAVVPVGPGSGPSFSCTASFAPVGYAGEITIVCDFAAVEVNVYTVQVTVDGGYYTGYNEDVLVIYDPSLGFTTGGGWFYWPDTTDKTNFGYTMKYNKKGTNVKGSLLLIRHTAEGNYRVKSNALYGLALGESGDPAFGWASFSGKTTYLEPGWSEPVGNYVFLVYVEDHGVPGAGVDRFWIEVLDKQRNAATLSMARDAFDHAEGLDGGNIVVPH
jgi:hypothetical protein